MDSPFVRELGWGYKLKVPAEEAPSGRRFVMPYRAIEVA